MTRYLLTDKYTGEILNPRVLSRPPRVTRRRVSRARSTYMFTNTRSVIANSWGAVTLVCSGLALVVAISK